MTARERAVFVKDIERREEEYLIRGLSGEEAHFQACEDAEMAYDEYQDRLHDEAKDERFEDE